MIVVSTARSLALLLLLFGALLTNVQAASATIGTTERSLVVYGTDDRKQESEVSSFMKSVGRSTVMIVKRNSLSYDGRGSYRLLDDDTFARAYGERQCNGDAMPFANEINPGTCSGTLITERHIATAGHCIEDEAECEDRYFVFGATDEQVALREFPESTVFECRSLHSSIYQPMFGQTSSERVRTSFKLGLGRADFLYADFAVLELARSVPSSVATPARVRIGSKVEMAEEVFIVGHPSGLPRKYAESRVNYVGPILPAGDYSWAAPLDSFAGNSGSGVFSKATGEMVGIHVNGVRDYIEGNGCETINVCPDQGPDDHPLSDKRLVRNINSLPGSQFDSAVRTMFRDCGGEWQTGTTVLGAALIDINGCERNAQCKNGGFCQSGRCECPTGYFGADCSQAKSRALCNGVGENTGYFQCECPAGTVSPVCHPCSGCRSSSVARDYCGDNDSPAMRQLFQCRGSASSIGTEAPSLSTVVPTAAPSQSPTIRTAAPTVIPTKVPTKAPITESPSTAPSPSPSAAPSTRPSAEPSAQPSSHPSVRPSIVPSASPSVTPTASPSAEPTSNPSGSPSRSPSESPSTNPSISPSSTPVNAPTSRLFGASVHGSSISSPETVSASSSVSNTWVAFVVTALLFSIALYQVAI